MPTDYLHHHPDFSALLRIVAEQKGINPILVEKDYWMMHCLYGLQKQGFSFELKGGTSLSKGFGIIHRFSEDIDIRINPPAQLEVKTGRNHNKEAHIKSRKNFYAWLAGNIEIDGIDSVERDYNFDDLKLRSGGIRLLYEERFGALHGLKSGILLEAGFDDVTLNRNKPRLAVAPALEDDQAADDGEKLGDQHGQQAHQRKCHPCPQGRSVQRNRHPAGQVIC